MSHPIAILAEGRSGRRPLLPLILLAALGLCACTTPGSRIEQHPDIFQSATPQQQAMIRDGEVGLGFTPDFVRLAMGEPDRITEREDAGGKKVIWHYVSYPNYTTTNSGYGWGYGRPWYWGWGSDFPPVVVVNEPAQERDKLRVVFQENKAVTIERVVKDDQ